MSPCTLAIGLVGPGLIGRTLLGQIASQGDKLREARSIDMRVVGIANSKSMLVRDDGIALASWPQQLAEQGVAIDLNEFGNQLQSMQSMRHKVIVDCTANDEVAACYARWMGQSIHIVTPNKKLQSGPLAAYREVRDLQRAGKAHYLYEAVCGAGLPVMGTLKTLCDTGDDIIRIEGILSGTLSYLFNSLGHDGSFSAAVADAKRLGFTEPDPREDLSGADMARKFVSLARECGGDIEMSDVSLRGLVPPQLTSPSLTPSQFMEQLPQYDDDMRARLREADDAGCVLRYVGCYDAAQHSCSVELRRFPKTHAFAGLQGTDNVVSFTTRRYCDNPLIVRGPGAGAEVTAAGVLGDIIQLARYLGAPS